MPKDDRDVLEVLKFELGFIEKGGYGRSVRTPWKATSAFQDSVTCINFGDPLRTDPCDECLLIQFVPAERRSENVPCHHIPLNRSGETIATVEDGGRHEQMEEDVKEWLRATIKRIEAERAQKAGAQN